MTRHLLVFVALVGCAKAKSSDQASSDEPSKTAEPGKTAEPAKSGGGGGASGAVPEFTLKPIDPSEAQDIPTLKDRVGDAVSKWLSEDTTPDGWILTYEIPHRDNVQDEKTYKVTLEVVGTYYGVYVRRMIDGQPYKCVTQTLEKRDDIARVVAACKTAKPN